MLGQLLYPTLRAQGLRVRALLQNIDHGRDRYTEIDPQTDYTAELRVYKHGILQHIDPQFAVVPFNKTFEITSQNLPTVANEGDDALIMVRVATPKGGNKFFYQAHQIFVENPKTEKFTAIQYEHMPVLPATVRPNPVILLAPKIWISRHINSHIFFANGWDTKEPMAQPEPMDLRILTEDGKTIYREIKPLMYNDIWVFDVKAALQDKITLSDKPQFFNAVARGGSGMFVIATILLNSQTGNIAFEHSLWQNYFLNGDMQRVRREAVQFDAMNQLVAS